MGDLFPNPANGSINRNEIFHNQISINMDILAKIKSELEAIELKKKEMVSQLQKEFPSIIQPLLMQDDAIMSVSWRQYTPYFNDGDECVFGAHLNDIEVNGEDLYELDGYEESWERKHREPNNLEKTVDQIKTVLAEVPEEFYKELFGDHVRVTINRDGTVQTEEYEHD